MTSESHCVHSPQTTRTCVGDHPHAPPQPLLPVARPRRLILHQPLDVCSHVLAQLLTARLLLCLFLVFAFVLLSVLFLWSRPRGECPLGDVEIAVALILAGQLVCQPALRMVGRLLVRRDLCSSQLQIFSTVQSHHCHGGFKRQVGFWRKDALPRVFQLVLGLHDVVYIVNNVRLR